MLIAPLNLEFQPSIEPNVVVFDVQRRGYTTDLNVSLMNNEGEEVHRVLCMKSMRAERSQRLALALIDISQADPEVNDGWVRMGEIVPGRGGINRVRDARAIMKSNLSNISEDFGGLLEFRNVFRAGEVRAAKPFGVAYTLRSKHHA